MDGGAWQATVHGVAKSWTRLSNFTHSLTQGLLTFSFLLSRMFLKTFNSQGPWNNRIHLPLFQQFTNDHHPLPCLHLYQNNNLHRSDKNFTVSVQRPYVKNKTSNDTSLSTTASSKTPPFWASILISVVAEAALDSSLWKSEVLMRGVCVTWQVDSAAYCSFTVLESVFKKKNNQWAKKKTVLLALLRGQDYSATVSSLQNHSV